MPGSELFYSMILICGTFIGSVSQVLLKKSALKKHDSIIREYLNPYVVTAYAMFVIATLFTVTAFKGIPLSLGPLLDSTGYLFVTIFGLIFFKEKLNVKRVAGLAIIIAGIVVYSL